MPGPDKKTSTGVQVGVAFPEVKRPSLAERLMNIRNQKLVEERIRGEVTGITEGFLYVLSHPSWSDWYKIGQTTDYEERLATYQVYSPQSYAFEFVEYVTDRVAAEQELKIALQSLDRKGEWYNVDLASLTVIASNIAKKLGR